MPSQEVGAFENTAVWNVNTGHDLLMCPDTASAEVLPETNIMEKSLLSNKYIYLSRASPKDSSFHPFQVPVRFGR